MFGKPPIPRRAPILIFGLIVCLIIHCIQLYGAAWGTFTSGASNTSHHISTSGNPTLSLLFNQVVALFIGPDGLIFSCPQCSNMGSGAQVEFERMFHNFMPSLVPQMKEFQSNLFCLLTSVSPTGRLDRMSPRKWRESKQQLI